MGKPNEFLIKAISAAATGREPDSLYREQVAGIRNFGDKKKMDPNYRYKELPTFPI